ncbi:MAG: RluA family pseudouridine synthase [Bacilli bacterium]|nr:RluA family pseudouridine synthase [Bacilli bacterium]
METKIIVTEEYSGERIDKFLTSQLTNVSRNNIINLIEEGYIKLNGKTTKPSNKLKENDEIIVEQKENVDLDVLPENIPLDIIYEDEDLLVINKPQGMVVHPSNGHTSGTLVNALLYHCKDLSGINGVKRPGIVHRIDKDTSGLIVVCKNDFTHNGIAAQLVDHTMHREYFALVKGVIKEDDGKIIAAIGRDPYDRFKMAVNLKDGKDAITYFHVEKRFNQYTLVSCRLTTGRTHQIRVHMNYIGHPIEGDPVYGNKKNYLYDKGQLLHAYRLTFIHPRTQKEMKFEISLPNYFKNIINELE